jgi:hypothetical protein
MASQLVPREMLLVFLVLSTWTANKIDLWRTCSAITSRCIIYAFASRLDISEGAKLRAQHIGRIILLSVTGLDYHSQSLARTDPSQHSANMVMLTPHLQRGRDHA